MSKQHHKLQFGTGKTARGIFKTVRDRFLVDRDERGEEKSFSFSISLIKRTTDLIGLQRTVVCPATGVRAAVRRWPLRPRATVAPPPTKGFMLAAAADSTVARVAAGGRREAHREGKMARGGRERERRLIAQSVTGYPGGVGWVHCYRALQYFCHKLQWHILHIRAKGLGGNPAPTALSQPCPTCAYPPNTLLSSIAEGVKNMSRIHKTCML